MSVNIVSRAAWGARAPKRRYTINTPTPRLWLHHTAGSEPDGVAGLRRIQAFHMDTRRWSDIAYSFVIDRRGVIHEGRGAGVAGGHTAGDNSTSHAICVIGNYDVQHPTQAQIAAIADLIRHGRANGWWGDLTGGHRDAPGASTACPGRHLYAAIPRIRQAAEGGSPPVPEEDEVKQEDIDAIAQKAADLTFGLIKRYGLAGQTKDDIAKRVWLADVHGKPARNRLHDADVKASQIRKEVAEHAEDVTPPDPPEESEVESDAEVLD